MSKGEKKRGKGGQKSPLFLQTIKKTIDGDFGALFFILNNH
jgi:hypothetical protein